MADKPTDTTDQQAVTVAQEDWVTPYCAWMREVEPIVGTLCSPETGFSAGWRAALARLASVSSASADGFVLVPREPTEAMVNACQDNLYSSNPSWNDPREIWSAMLAASPEPVPATNQAGEVEPLSLRLAVAEVASCSCNTKTNEPRFHEGRCLYRVLRDAQAEIERLTTLNDKYFWQVRDTCARAEKAEASLATQPATSQEGEGKLHRKLRTIYDVLHDIHDRCEDEGDRIYLGSTEDRHTLKRQLRYLEKLIPDALLYPTLAATPAPPTLNSWANTPEAEHERILLMAEIELHLKSCRIFLTSREKMHPVGVDIHDELLAKVTAVIEATGSEKAHG